MKYSVRKLLFLFVFALFLAPGGAWADLGQFAIVSDTHVGSPNSRYDTFIREVAREGVTTVIHTGDALNSPGDEAKWAEFRRMGEGERVFLTPGNHDIRDVKSYSAYLSAFHDPYYSFSEGDTLFVFLNTEIPGHRRRIDGEQLSWLNSELDRPFRYKFVFLHEPLYPFLPYNGLDRYRKARNGLHNLFARKGVSMVVAGHDHVYGRMMKDGVEYVIMPSTGGRVPWLVDKEQLFGYMLVTRTENGYGFVMKDLSGRVKDEFALDRSPSGPTIRTVSWPGLLRSRLNRLESLIAGTSLGRHRPFLAVDVLKPSGL
jgi:3',5'-cyclic AMP phosphodiesterase CpdA